MSFWDTVKPAKKNPQVSQVELSADQRTLSLTWTDGASHQVPSRRLRQLCPCAECVEEWSGKRTFDVERIPVDMKIVEVASMGNYALTFTFGDLHRTGIFNWEYLREVAQRGG